MHYDTAWHAQGLRWIASILESAAAYLERTSREAKEDCLGPNRVEEVRLRVHLRGL